MLRENKSGNASGNGADLRPDPKFGNLLESAYGDQQLMGMKALEQIVNSAPPVRATLLDRMAAIFTAKSPARRMGMAFSGSVALLALMFSVMFVMPAVSDYTGTIATTKLPSGWQPGSDQYNELRQASQAAFADYGAEQGMLHLMVMPREGRDDLTFVMVGLDEDKSKKMLAGLAERYPALGAYETEYEGIESKQYPNLLSQMVSRVSGSDFSNASDEQIRVDVLRELKQQGFEDIEMEVQRQADGSVVIEVEATMAIRVQGHSQEELEASGISPQLIGEEAYQNLLTEIGL